MQAITLWQQKTFTSMMTDLMYWLWPTSEQINEAAEWKLLKRVKGIKWATDGHPCFAENPISDDGPGSKTIEGANEKNSGFFKQARVLKVPVRGSEFMNTFIMTDNITSKKEKKVLVMAHGFGVGLGLYYRNYQALAELKGWDVYSIDWLGMGRSSRPRFNLRKKRNQTEEEHIKEAEDFFVDSLEEWRKELKIDKFHLMGHSLGGYLSTVYTLKYPDNVEKLILASPVGIPPSPFLPSAAGQEQQQLIADHTIPPPANSEIGRRPKIPFWVPYAWNNLHVTPQWVVRLAGPYGPKLVTGYVSRRFAHLEPDSQEEVRDYLYHIASMKGSGEYALSTILSFGAFARKPLVKRLPDVNVPITFVYGEVDWMDHRHAERLKNTLKYPAKIEVLPKVGHQLFIEKPEQFNKFLVDELLKS